MPEVSGAGTTPSDRFALRQRFGSLYFLRNERWANQIEAQSLIGSRVAQEQAAAFGGSAAMSRTIIGAGLSLRGSAIRGWGAMILSEAARLPAARIATTKTVNAVDKALQKPLGSLPQKAGGHRGSESGRELHKVRLQGRRPDRPGYGFHGRPADYVHHHRRCRPRNAPETRPERRRHCKIHRGHDGPAVTQPFAALRARS